MRLVHHVRQLFANFEDLVVLSEIVTDKLGQQEKRSPDSQTIGAIFAELAMPLKDAYVTVWRCIVPHQLSAAAVLLQLRLGA